MVKNETLMVASVRLAVIVSMKERGELLRSLKAPSDSKLRRSPGQALGSLVAVTPVGRFWLPDQHPMLSYGVARRQYDEFALRLWIRRQRSGSGSGCLYGHLHAPTVC